MPNIVTALGITIDEHKDLITKHSCKECGSKHWRPIAFVRGIQNSAFCYECMVCHQNDFFVYTQKAVTSPDRIVNIVNSIGELNDQMRNEPSGGICQKCKMGTISSIGTSKCNRMCLDIIECSNCRFSIPVISIVRDTLIAYSYNIKLAKKVSKEHPEIAVIFCIAALETYFRQIFEYRSELNKFLVNKRRISFQNLKEIKTVLKKEFALDIVKFIEDDWQFLVEATKWRNRIIHHASFDEKGRKIIVSETEIDQLISLIDKLVFKVEMKLFNDEIVI